MPIAFHSVTDITNCLDEEEDNEHLCTRHRCSILTAKGAKLLRWKKRVIGIFSPYLSLNSVQVPRNRRHLWRLVLVETGAA